MLSAQLVEDGARVRIYYATQTETLPPTFTIFVNHIPGIYFETFTYRNFGFSDSAELFVLAMGFRGVREHVRCHAASAARIAPVNRK